MKKTQLMRKGIMYIYRKTLFFNVRNKSAQNYAYNCFCYKKLKRKYRSIVDDFKSSNSIQKQSDYVWIMWLQGIENAPILVKKCYESVKKNLPNKKIIVLDELNLKKYVQLPDYIEKKYKKGIISHAHYSDLVRLEVLIKHGGLWLDSTVFMTDTLDSNFFKNQLFVFKNVSLDRDDLNVIVASNWLIYSYSNNPILELTKELLLKYWKKNNLLLSYNIFHLFFTMATEKYSKEWEDVPVNSNILPHILQFELLKKYDENKYNEIKKLSVFHKLNHRIKTDDKDSFYYKLFLNR